MFLIKEKIIGLIMKIFIKIGLGLLSLTAITLFLMSGTMQSTSVAQNVSINKRVPSSDAEVKLSYAPVVREAAPAVVNIYTKRVVRTRTSPFLNDPFFSRFFGGSSAPRERIERSLGSGVIVRQEGIVITNHHVIEGAD
jgi:serine protease Do